MMFCRYVVLWGTPCAMPTPKLVSLSQLNIHVFVRTLPTGTLSGSLFWRCTLTRRWRLLDRCLRGLLSVIPPRCDAIDKAHLNCTKGCGGMLQMRTNGHTGEPFWGCNNHTRGGCRGSASWNLNWKPPPSERERVLQASGTRSGVTVVYGPTLTVLYA